MTENNEKQVLDRQVADWTRERDRLNGLIALATGQARQQKSEKPAEREAFEAWAKGEVDSLKKGNNGGYLYADATLAWKAWQACATLVPAAPVAQGSYAMPPAEYVAGYEDGQRDQLAEACHRAMSDADIDKIAETMPGGMDGFLKGWGWRQFARAVEGEIVSRTILSQAAPRADHIEDARQMVASGCKLVPVDATQEMIDAISRAIKWDEPVWPAALAAAPSASAQQAKCEHEDELPQGDPCPECPEGAVCKTIQCGRNNLRTAHAAPAPSASPETMVHYGGGETPISFEDGASPAALTDAKTLALGAMVDAMRWWGAQEDGIPAECKKAFDSAMLALGWSYSHPQDLKVLAASPAAQGDDARDAARYRGIRSHFLGHREFPSARVGAPMEGNANYTVWRRAETGAEFDHSIDAAMSADGEV